MQAYFLDSEAEEAEFRSTLSEARLSRYIKAANGNITQSFELYHQNSEICQGLYIPLQMWEIALRNRINDFLIYKYGSRWPFNQRLTRNLKSADRTRLDEAINRQAQQRGVRWPSTDSIVADLSAGFWVSLLTKSYDVPFSWRYNITRVFPNCGQPNRESLWQACDRLLKIRNRVAHHEPIFHFVMPDMCNDLETIIGYLCQHAKKYVTLNSDLQKIRQLAY